MKIKIFLTNNFGYLTIILAFMISVQMLYSINSENRINFIESNETDNSLLSSINPIIFKEGKTVEISERKFEYFFQREEFIYLFDLGLKCGISFILGAILSERKFLILGKF